ncbi:MAG: endopeptidase La [Lachnospiraceae bacterium]|nr:endopeptidase La [Lachnospiraceae bacterium]
MIVVPVYNMILTPDSTMFLQTEQLKKNAGQKGGPAVGERVIFVVAKNNETHTDFSEDSFYPVGLSGTIRDINQNGFCVIRTQYRVNIQDVSINPDRSIELSLSRRNEIQDLDPDVEEEKLKNILEEMQKFAEGFEWADSMKFWMDQIDSIGTAAAVCSPWMRLPNEERYAILEEDSREKRTELLEKVLYDFLEVGRIRKEAVSSQQKEYQKMYRESAIKRQMEHLQKELDEMHPENMTDARRFEEKIQNSGMNENARKEAEKVLNRFKQEGGQGPESGMLYDYLDFITGLSWKKEAAERIDLAEARRILDEDHYGLKKVKERIIQQIAVMNLKKEQSGSILLFVGAPGTGKTSIGKSIARALGREYVRVSLGGVHDESDIRGHRRTYIGAMPGRIMDGIHKAGVSNPVMVLDEVDKLSASYNGSPASALLEVLDPEQNNTFTDHYMNVPYDLSDVLFICTANTADTIPEPLLNRMEIIQFSGYTPEEKFNIAKEHLVQKSREQMGILPEQLEFEDETLRHIIASYTMEAGVRGLRKCIDTLCRSLAVSVSEAPETCLHVTPELADEKLDARPIRHSRILPEPRSGVVTGLAWTQAGGEILYIETLFTKGSGKLIITGQLGDVMKESAQIAVSLVKEMFPDKVKLFEENDLHIHVPAGAVPKDGPSAGVTLTTALASLVLDIPVDTHIAMTGEISLRQEVMPIGGLPEKLMAAERAGVTKVFIPEENLDDLREVASEVLDALEIVPVTDVEELLACLGIHPKEPTRIAV